MTPREAQSAGRSITLKATLVCLAIPFLIRLYEETKGDFANGILFYMHYALAPANLISLTIILGCTFLLGGWAGKEIIISKKNMIITAVKYAVLIYAVEFIYLFITYSRLTMHLALGADQNLFLLVVSSSMYIAIIILVAWLYAAYRLLHLRLKNKTS